MRISHLLPTYFDRTHTLPRSILRAQWLYPALITLAVIAASLTTFLYPTLAIRPFLLMAFLLVCPGLTIVRFFQLHETMIEWLLALALSIAIDAFVAGVLVYAGRWSPTYIFIVLLSFCLIGALLQFMISVTSSVL